MLCMTSFLMARGTSTGGNQIFEVPIDIFSKAAISLFPDMSVLAGPEHHSR